MASADEPSGPIIGLFVGQPETLWPGKPPSSIRKSRVDGPVAIDSEGFTTDRQADLKVHGGPEKAIHHYAFEHMDFWKETFPDHGDAFRPGCFGENISTTGFTERNLYIGDVLSLGSARVKVCQGRQPCWKLNAHMGIKQMAAQFQLTGRTGWYYRVLENGLVSTGETMRLLDRPHPDFSVYDVTKARFDRRLDSAMAKRLSELDALSENWRAAFLKKVDRGFEEDTRARLIGD